MHNDEIHKGGLEKCSVLGLPSLHSNNLKFKLVVFTAFVMLENLSYYSF